jgi:cytochrome b561
MTFKNTTDRYHLSSVALHWVMLALFIGVYASIHLRELFDKGSAPREALKSLHFMLGLLMFALVWLRLSMRIKHAAPGISPTPPAWQEAAAKAAHLALYAIMIGMPLMGWLLLSAAGKPIPFFGLELPALIGPDKALAGQPSKPTNWLANWLLFDRSPCCGGPASPLHQRDTLLRMRRST